MVKGIYSKKVMAHFKKPHNYGKIKNADGIGNVGNLVCGDVMRLYIKIGKNKNKQEIIKDIKFETFGCVAAIATSSAITDLAKGKTLEEAAKISKTQIVDSLGELPPIKMLCSVLASDALVEAIYDYLSKNKKEISQDLAVKHERIAKEKEETEKRYKDWTDMEKKMLG